MDFKLRTLKELTQPRESYGSRSRVGEDEKRVALATQHIEGAKETIEVCISEPVVKRVRMEQHSNRSLYMAWQQVARQIASLLEVLWIRYGEYEESWMVPTRARLWIARRKVEDGKSKGHENKGSNPPVPPIFGMVMEILLEKEILKVAWDTFRNKRSNGGNTDCREFWAACPQAAISPIR